MTAVAADVGAAGRATCVADIHAALRAAPVRDLDEIVDWPALVLAPHADDESLAFGGLIAEAVARGREVSVLVLTDGTGSHPNSLTWPPERLQAQRELEARAAVAILGLPADRIGFLGAVDTRAPHDGPELESLVARLGDLCRARGVRTVLTCWRHDPHCDHEAASILVARVCARLGLRHLEAPVWGWTLDAAAVVDSALPRAARFDVAAHRERKRRAIGAHLTQTTRLIDDSPAGFLLEPAMIALLDQPHEVLIEP